MRVLEELRGYIDGEGLVEQHMNDGVPDIGLLMRYPYYPNLFIHSFILCLFIYLSLYLNTTYLLSVRITLLSLFESIYLEEESLQPRLEEFAKVLNVSALHPLTALLIKKTILSPIREKEIRQSLVPTTLIDEENNNKLVNFYNSICPLFVWDTAGELMGRYSSC